MIVDIHSHVFNADDLPIEGFIKKLFAAPRLVTGVISVPLDRLAQRRAPSDERARLLSLLRPGGALEGFGPLPEGGDELISDAEFEQLFAAEWQRLGLLPKPPESGPFEGFAPLTTDVQLEAALVAAPPAEVHELEAWLEEWDPDRRDAGAPPTNLEGFGNVFGPVCDAKRAIGRFLSAFRLITRYRFEIAAELARAYPSVSLFVPALVDFQYTTSDNPSADIREQIAIHSLVAKLSMAGRLPGAPQTRVAPLVGFDPYREVAETALRDWDPDRGVRNSYVPYAAVGSTDPQDRYRRTIRFDETRARSLRRPASQEWDQAVLELAGVQGGVDLVRHAVELGGFVGVKLYPPAGFLPLGNALRFGGTKGERLDAALRALYAYCVAMDVPILTHASHSNGFEDDYNAFAGPAGWELVLAEYPDLRLCLGHFGHLHGIGVDPDGYTDGWPSRFVELIDRYPHVYADVGNSKVPISDKYRSKFLAVLSVLLGGTTPDAAQQRRRRRLLYGSDFWMNTLSPDHDRYLSTFRDSYEETFDPVATEAFMGGNALRFLGFNGNDDQPDLSNRNRKRFVAFHGSNPTPDWLQKGT